MQPPRYPLKAIACYVPTAAMQQAREIVLRYGCGSFCCRILQAGFEYWFSRKTCAVIGYKQRGHYLVCGGEPACSQMEYREVLAEFELWARRQGLEAIYFGVEKEAARQHHRYASIALGAEPIWEPSHWNVCMGQSSGFRKQLRRATNKGISIVEMAAGAASARDRMRRALARWVASRAMPPLGFLADVRPPWVANEQQVVLAGEQHGQMVAYITACPIPQGRGYLIDQIVRTPDAPNGTSELLIDAMMRRLYQQGAQFVSLGLVALSQHAPKASMEASWLGMAQRLARRYGSQWYNFAGLEAFRSRLRPQRWEPLYMMFSRRLTNWDAAYGAASAFFDLPLWKMACNTITNRRIFTC
ncbi:MAG: DUF2156 domain-containing protein [Phycisphaerales bacterium]|nr:DUF2156 domain-containing protein [Phycisphaerales bacterium]